MKGFIFLFSEQKLQKIDAVTDDFNAVFFEARLLAFDSAECKMSRKFSCCTYNFVARKFHRIRILVQNVPHGSREIFISQELGDLTIRHHFAFRDLRQETINFFFLHRKERYNSKTREKFFRAFFSGSTELLFFHSRTGSEDLPHKGHRHSLRKVLLLPLSDCPIF